MEYYMTWNGNRQPGFYASLDDARSKINKLINQGYGGTWKVYYSTGTNPSYTITVQFS